MMKLFVFLFIPLISFINLVSPAWASDASNPVATTWVLSEPSVCVQLNGSYQVKLISCPENNGGFRAESEYYQTANGTPEWTPIPNRQLTFIRLVERVPGDREAFIQTSDGGYSYFNPSKVPQKQGIIVTRVAGGDPGENAVICANSAAVNVGETYTLCRD
ncbi:MAG: hypothetical protein A3F41_03270 [Coxiella sp. RIFCSPHIGHO2_12_FULL_44_14]|nr:MAG: hypothetical protein A3F41_03270 [Coxiella sp. RIFCSPHIGHO2_12_FULL_44_14]